MMKNIVFSLALLGALTETGPAFAESKSLPDCAVTSAKSHGVELALFRALMIHELGETPLAAPCSFYEAAAANLATSLNSQHGDRWGAVSLFIHGRVLLDDPVVERVRTIYESKQESKTMAEKPQAIPDSTTEQEQCLGVFNAGHGVVTTPSSYDPALYERFKRIYSEGEPVIITGNMKVFRP